jgi:hypothetical protein
MLISRHGANSAIGQLRNIGALIVANELPLGWKRATP